MVIREGLGFTFVTGKGSCINFRGFGLNSLLKGKINGLKTINCLLFTQGSLELLPNELGEISETLFDSVLSSESQ